MKTSLYLSTALLCLLSFFSCSKEQLPQLEETIKEETTPTSTTTAHSRGLTSVYITSYGYRGSAEHASDCPTGMGSCLTGDFMYRMESLEEGLDYIKNVDPTMVLGKLTFNEDHTLSLDMIATGVEYEHNDKKEDVLIVPEGGIELPQGIVKGLDAGGYNGTVKEGKYPIRDKKDAMFWSGIVTLILE